MLRIAFLIWLVVSCGHATAQSDLLVFKKKNRTIQSWSSGSYIIFQMENRQWLEGYVRRVWRDSVRIELVKIDRVINNWGTYDFDTTGMGLLILHVKELRALPKKNFSYNLFSNGQFFRLGALGYASLNIINSLARRDPVFAPDNLGNLGIAGAVFLTGTLLGSFHRTYWETGKKYRFEIVRLSQSNQQASPAAAPPGQ
ncbi:MAG: hypothetical protein ACK57C_06865 [Bacteroidota bacterium]